MPSETLPNSAVRRTEPYRQGGIEIRPAPACLGAEIVGMDLSRPMTADDLSVVKGAWAEHLVLLWRDQHLSVEQHIAFGRNFGELEPMSHVASARELPPEILVIENDPILNESTEAPEPYRQGFRFHPVQWHSDNSYRPVPPKGSVFYVRESPPTGGATLFSNMYAALETLPFPLRSQIEGRSQIHDPSLNSANVLRKGAKPPDDVSRGTGPRHPMIRRHPETGRNALYLGRRPYAYVCGLTVAESETLLDRLWSHAASERFVWQREGNRRGDMFLWDNRCAMHARDPLDSGARRLAHRVQILGESPVPG
jgi:taurine dioxygenase